MDKKFLKDVLSVPTISMKEELMRDYIIKFAETNGLENKVDRKGNVYLTQGSEKMTSGEYYPCVVSHIDTVHRNQIDLIDKDIRLAIVEDDKGHLTAYHPDTGDQTGIGGDDKCGVFVCLSLFENLDVLKGAFFVEEEIGMRGSKEADPTFFENVGYAIQFDAPSDNWITEICSGVKILADGFKEKVTPILKEGGYTMFSNDPFTDVNQLAQKFDFNCLNLGCGYHNQHSASEYVVMEEVKNSLEMGEKLIYYLGNNKYIFFNSTDEELLMESDYERNFYEKFYESENEDSQEDYYDEYANEIVEAVLKMKEEGYDPDIIKFEIAELLYSKDIFKFN